MSETTEPDLVEEVEELLASWRPSEIVKQPEQVRELLRRLVEEVKLWKGQTESLVAAFDRDDYGDEEVVRITREAALNVAKEELGWPK